MDSENNKEKEVAGTASGVASTLTLVIKWSGKEYEVSEVRENDTVGRLKTAIFGATGVRPERQKLLNLRHKGRMPDDDVRLSALRLRPGTKLMLMGSLEEDIAEANAPPKDAPTVVNDLDVDIEDDEVAIENQEVYLEKVARRVRDYKINVLNEPRPHKKLLVLDIDYTLFDHRSAAETGLELMRPYLHEFLTTAYNHYDIVIWSATGMKWIEEKMKLLGVSTHQAYKIMFYLDSLAMISVHTPKYGVVEVSHRHTWPPPLQTLILFSVLAGQTAWRDLGQIPAVQQRQHDNV